LGRFPTYLSLELNSMLAEKMHRACYQTFSHTLDLEHSQATSTVKVRTKDFGERAQVKSKIQELPGAGSPDRLGETRLSKRPSRLP